MGQTIGLVLKHGSTEAFELLDVVRRTVPDATLLVEGRGQHALADPPRWVEVVAPAELESSSDLVVVLGGDGTLIHAAGLLQSRIVPVLGVNLGRIGFLTEVPKDELAVNLQGALDGRARYEDRMRLRAEVVRDGEVILERILLNDAVVSQASLARIVTYRITLGEELVTTLRADGVILSTPTGSTAYSMAAGGPIVSPGIEAIVVAPISAQALTHRPLLVSAGGELRVHVDSDDPTYVTIDGQTGQDFMQGDLLRVQRAPVPTRLVVPAARNYFQTLRTKLRWGES